MIDLLEKFFGKQQLDSWEKNKDAIIEYIKSLNDEFVLSTPSIDITEIGKRIKNPDYLSNLEVGIKNGVNLIYPSMEIWNIIKKYIPKNIKRITVPYQILLQDYKFLSTFPYLEELYVKYYKLDPEVFLYLKNNTNIKRINAQYNLSNEKEYVEKTDAIVSKGSKDYIYDEGIEVISEEGLDRTCLDISSKVFDFNKIYQLINGENIQEYERININDKDNNLYSINLSNNTMEVNDINYDNIIEIIKLFNSKNINFNKIEINVENVDYTAFDYEKLTSVINTDNIIFRYESVSKATYEDFISLVEAIKWYRQLIADYDLSPVEKLMYAYDIMKTFAYKENEDDKSMSRYPDKILKSGNIVCVGYSNFLQEILKYVDPGIAVNCASVTCVRESGEEGHQRNVVRIDDDKYNIHGIFVVDATWDSEITSEKLKNYLGDSYTALDLYNYFLIPYEDYEKTFKGDTLPPIYEYKKDMTSDKDKKMVITDWPVAQTLKDLFGTDKVDEGIVQQYLNTKRPSLHQFCEMLYAVRLAEGYTPEMIQEEIIKIQQINSNSIGLLNERGVDIEFFQDEGKSR